MTLIRRVVVVVLVVGEAVSLGSCGENETKASLHEMELILELEGFHKTDTNRGETRFKLRVDTWRDFRASLLYDSDQAVVTLKADYLQSWDISPVEFAEWEQHHVSRDSPFDGKRHSKGEREMTTDWVELNYELNKPGGFSATDIVRIKDSFRLFMKASASFDFYSVRPIRETGWTDPRLIKYR